MWAYDDTEEDDIFLGDEDGVNQDYERWVETCD